MENLPEVCTISLLWTIWADFRSKIEELELIDDLIELKSAGLEIVWDL